MDGVPAGIEPRAPHRLPYSVGRFGAGWEGTAPGTGTRLLVPGDVAGIAWSFVVVIPPDPPSRSQATPDEASASEPSTEGSLERDEASWR
jgi:hypothetical protein